MSLNLIGALDSKNGLGEAARQLNAVLHTLNLQIAHIHDDELPSPEARNYPLNLLLASPFDLSQYPSDHLQSVLAGHYTIAYWFNELTHLPRYWLPLLPQINEFWCASHHMQMALQSYAPDAHYLRVPVPIQTYAVPQPIGRQHFGLPHDRFIVLFSFAAPSSFARKNPFGVIEAFKRAFVDLTAHASAPLLVIRAHRLAEFPHAARELRHAVARVNGILIEQGLSRQHMNDLLGAADVYLSLHRAEGFGMGMAESMYLGKPVIATGYSANLDFMNAANSYLVRHDMCKITEADHVLQTGFEPHYAVGYEWAQPDLDHAASLLRHVYEHMDEARQKGLQAAQDIRAYCSPVVVAEIVKTRIMQLYAAHPEWVNATITKYRDREQFERERALKLAQITSLQQRGRELTDRLLEIQRLYQDQTQFPTQAKNRLVRYSAKLLGRKLPLAAPVLPDPAPLQAELNEVNVQVIALLNQQLRSLERQLLIDR